jgi:hypothetical protein
MKRSSPKGKKGKRRIRLPLPRKPGHAHGTAKGKKGYDRKGEHETLEQEKKN